MNKDTLVYIGHWEGFDDNVVTLDTDFGGAVLCTGIVLNKMDDGSVQVYLKQTEVSDG